MLHRRIAYSKRNFFFGLVAFVGFALLGQLARHDPQFHPDLIDGLQGFLLAIGTALLILTVWRNERR